eukprot:754811-Hanusia_phi.AAC.3
MSSTIRLALVLQALVPASCFLTPSIPLVRPGTHSRVSRASHMLVPIFLSCSSDGTQDCFLLVYICPVSPEVPSWIPKHFENASGQIQRYKRLPVFPSFVVWTCLRPGSGLKPLSQQQCSSGEWKVLCRLQGKTALRDTAIAVSLASAFGVGIWNFLGADKALEYFTGYLLVLQSSSIPTEEGPFLWDMGEEMRRDIIFVRMKQGAVVMRAAFISAGLVAIQQFRGVLLVFAGLLMYSSFKMLSGESGNNIAVSTRKRAVRGEMEAERMMGSEGRRSGEDLKQEEKKRKKMPT